MPRLALVGNLSHDLVDGAAPRLGGAPVYCGHAFQRLDVRAAIVARCGPVDVPDFRGAFARLGLPVKLLPGTATTAFEISYDGDTRIMSVARIGDVWHEHDVAGVPAATWVHVGALLRDDFTASTVARLARGRRLSFDGQGLTRVRTVGPLRLERDPDDALLRHIAILKLAAEEAEALVGGVDARALAELGPPEVLVTFGSGGSLVVANGDATEVPARHVDADPTGSGDVFAAGYLSARAAGHAPVAAARVATALVGDILRARLR